MVSPEPLLLAVAADGRELAGFPSKEPARLGVRWSYWSRWASGKTLMVADGIGREAARRAVSAALALHPITAVISIGYVGSLQIGWPVGDLFLAEEVLLPADGLRYPVSLIELDGETTEVRRGRLATVDRVVATVEGKRRLASFGADAVDMEAFEVAEQARTHRLPFFCVRAISDDAETALEFDFDRARRADGTVSGSAVIAQAGLSPVKWRKLFELKRNGELAARNLAQFLIRCRFPLESSL